MKVKYNGRKTQFMNTYGNKQNMKIGISSRILIELGSKIQNK